MTETTHTYPLTGYSSNPATATVTTRCFEPREPTRRAVKGLATFWGVALATVFIPVAHFVLVPSFALYGAFTFFERLGAQEIVVKAEGVCPDCGRPQALDVHGRWRARVRRLETASAGS